MSVSSIICVDGDLATGPTSISLRTTHDDLTRRLDYRYAVVVSEIWMTGPMCASAKTLPHPELKLRSPTSQSCFEVSLARDLHTDVGRSQLERSRRPLLKQLQGRRSCVSCITHTRPLYWTLHSLKSLRITLQTNIVLHPVHNEGQWKRHKQCAPTSCPPHSKKWTNKFSRPSDPCIRLASARRLRTRQFKTPWPGVKGPATPRTVRACPSRTVLPRSSV